MKYLDDKHKRKGLIKASIIMILLVILMFISGLTYLDPPPETGIAVNFGTSDMGSGNIQPQQNTPPKPKKIIKNTPQTKPQIKEEVLTQNNEEAPVIKKKKKKKPVRDNKPQPDTKPKEEKPVPDKNITDILNNVKNAPGENTNNSKGEGTDNTQGDKGSRDGDPNASGYYGNGGSGGGGTGNYRLGNRKALNKPKPDFNCNEQGIVVVKIYVDAQGHVKKAQPGMKGTTNPAPCLLEAAKKAALKTKWSPDANAPTLQIGKIIYHFKIRE
jgi:outer membrane biosynthesis protein TonB